MTDDEISEAARRVFGFEELRPGQYEAVRAHPTHFINARGHAANGGGWVRVLDEFDRYTVVEKVGEAAEIVAELDPRGEVSS